MRPRMLALSTTTALVWWPVNAGSPVLGGYVVGVGTVALAWAITRRPSVSTTTGTDPHGNDSEGGTEPPCTPTPMPPADDSTGPDVGSDRPLYLDDVLAQWANTPPATTGNPWVRPRRNDR